MILAFRVHLTFLLITQNLFLINKIFKYKTKICLWFVPKKSSLRPITEDELKWKSTLSGNKSLEFHHSRGYVRKVLSLIFDMPELKIPLFSPPARPPLLPSGMGFVSFSHCIDGLFIAWSSNNIGVDLERSDRLFNAKSIADNYFSRKEKEMIQSLEKEKILPKVLSYWVRKEAAIKILRCSIFKDLSNLEYLEESKQIYFKTKGIKINSYLIKYENWFLSIANNDFGIDKFPIICVL